LRIAIAVAWRAQTGCSPFLFDYAPIGKQTLFVEHPVCQRLRLSTPLSSVIARSNMIKGTDFAALWPDFLMLSLFTLMLVVRSVWRFRKMVS
jgi:hypothetical protein